MGKGGHQVGEGSIALSVREATQPGAQEAWGRLVTILTRGNVLSGGSAFIQ